MKYLGGFAAARVASNEHDGVVVDGVHDLGLHGVDGKGRPRFVALLQALVDLAAFRPVVQDILKVMVNIQDKFSDIVRAQGLICELVGLMI